MKLNIKHLLLTAFRLNKKPLHYDFYPNHIALIEKPLTPYSRYIASTISLSILAFILWVYFGKLDVQSPATGKLVVTGRSQIIQIHEPSRLAILHVKDGQKVNQGDALLTLDILGVDEEIKGIRKKRDDLLLLKIRYQALSQEVSPKNLYHFNKLDNKIKKSILSGYQKEKDEFDSNINVLETEIEVNNKNQTLTYNDLLSLKKIQNNIKQRFIIKEDLYNKKIISKMEYLESEKELLEINRSIIIKNSEFHIIKNQEKQLYENLNQLEKQKKLEWHDKYKKYESELLIYTQNFNHLQKRQKLKTVRSPITGTVQQISIYTLGSVLQPSQSVMTIVPEHQENFAEINLLNRDIGFIHIGQKAMIKIDAFPYTRYGTMEGEIINIAKDSVQHEQLGLVYPATIKLNKQTIEKNNQYYQLTPGMSLVAEIITDKRRVIDYVLSPIEVYRHNALTEK
ncbi:HlyD family type I secretion periplasmic adaptor subunit [Proteus vulgaris]|uniref:Membrane fusion protein (MFP) family protein n=2 Tax=Proteus vulgaris TaxID=585 RepID=A0A6G6SJK5_PROVU|nr:HlyD family type I secretion periplasmic adaptor subunit [Proteus vulgaris]QIF94908.1 HlyD family type I secretion periplasmic adaptor subunit [Proteus vulgaris]WIF71190.1 HlyD family type I secretion periplasmic adaptor subunit [Proteus vulgaris]